MICTDKAYFIDKGLTEKLDLAVERHKHGRDTMFIVDGGEGDGKSTACIGWAYYIAHKMGLPFSVDNVFFDAEKMMKFAASTTSQVIIWDEAATSGMAMNWQNRTQQKLIKILMMCRKKQHFWFFVIPKFFKLNEYIVDRAVGLMHVYSPDLVKQGYFVYFKKSSKDYLYQIMKERKYKSYRQHWSIRSTFVKKGFVINEKEYDKRKDAAIMDLFKDKKKEVTDFTARYKRWLKQMIKEKAKLNETTEKKICYDMGIEYGTYRAWSLKQANKRAQLLT